MNKTDSDMIYSTSNNFIPAPYEHRQIGKSSQVLDVHFAYSLLFYFKNILLYEDIYFLFYLEGFIFV